MIEGIHIHEPGRLSRWGVVDVGLKCTHSCRHCFYSWMGGSADQFEGMRHAKWHSAENLSALVDSLADHGFLGFDVTGGEPTAYPGIVDVVEHASRRGLASRIITLGQFLTRRGLLERLLDVGLTDFRFSLHSTDPGMFNRMTGGDLDRLVAAMDELQRRSFEYVTNTTVTEVNYTFLPEIARWIAARPEIYHANFLYFMPYYEWSRPGHVADHRVRHSEIAPYMREAVETVEAAGVAATVRYAPQCMTGGLERNHVGIVGVRHDTHEWMNAIDHMADPSQATPKTMRRLGMPIDIGAAETQFPLQPVNDVKVIAMRGSKVFTEKCRSCAGISVCDGIDRGYLAEFGDSEIKPYTEFRGDLLDRERLSYHPASVIKIAPYARARETVRSMFKESALCG